MLIRLKSKRVRPVSKEISIAEIYEALNGREGNMSVLEPAKDLQLNSDGGYCWQSKGNDPWFSVKNIDHKLRPSWYLIEVSIRSDSEHGRAKIYFDYGEGYSESYSVEIPYEGDGIHKRLYRISTTPHQVRFDPIDCSARFSIKRFNFSAVLPITAYYLMLSRLKSHSNKYKKHSLISILRDFKSQTKNQILSTKELLQKSYENTFVSDKIYGTFTYLEWIHIIENTELDSTTHTNDLQELLKYRPTISIVMPVYNTAERHLRKSIESVLAQSYSHWQLCIADDASTDLNIRRVLEEYRKRDPRIEVVFREHNGHISAASNSALALAVGEYVALLDHDDELAQHALASVVSSINQELSAQILYSDEDKIDELGIRSQPHFKSDWNPDMFFSQNYVSHLGVYRRDLLFKIGGFRTGVEGSQDQDLLLRCLPFVKHEEIIHIPKILYHWRMIAGSTALDTGEKSYTTDAGIKALTDYFSSQGRKDVKVDRGLWANIYRVRYPIPEPEPLISLLVPTRDMLEVLEPCIRSLIDKTTYKNYEIIILDNGSIEAPTRDYFTHIQAADSRVRVVAYDHPFNYSAINNFGVTQARGKLIGLINNDVEVISPEWLTEMVSHALRPEIGCVGAKLYYADETIQHAGVILGVGGVAAHSHKNFPRDAAGYFCRLKTIQNLSAVTAACLVVRKSIFEQVGGLEEHGLKVAFNDVDFCLKVRKAGYLNLWTPYAELYHHESKSRGIEDTPAKIERFNREIDFIRNKWGPTLQLDPYYNRNLTLNASDFSLRSS